MVQEYYLVECPIPKRGDRLNISNYRPISFLCTSKVLEKAVYNKIISFIRPRLSKQQFGFLQGRSCLSQLLTSFAQVFNDLDRGAAGIDAVFLDFRKAFDSVPHNELLFKLWRTTITSKLWLWFQEYLSCHRQTLCTFRKYFFSSTTSEIRCIL